MKLPLYERACIGENRIADVNSRLIITYADAPEGAYRSAAIFAPGDAIAVTMALGRMLRVEQPSN